MLLLGEPVLTQLLARQGTSMSIAWSGSVLERTSCNLGPLAVIAPLLEQMDVAGIIDRHLPPDPQLEYPHGQVLRLLLGARLCHPLALINVAKWAEESGAEFLWGIPARRQLPGKPGLRRHRRSRQAGAQ